MAEDWEEEEIIASVVTGVAASWEDEEEEGEIKAAWDDEDSEEEDNKKPVTSATKKKTLKEKIAEREAQRIAKLQEIQNEKEETALERKQREQQAIVESDMDNTKDLFGGGIADVPIIPVADDSSFNKLPKIRAEFLPYSDLLADKILELGQSPHYPILVENLVKKILQPCSAEVSRRVNTAVTAIVNEKQRAAKESQKKKKNSGKTFLKVGADDQTKSYDNSYDDFEDFM